MLVERYYAEMYIVRAQNESTVLVGRGKAFKRMWHLSILKDSIRQKVFWEWNVRLGQGEGEARAKVWLYGPVWHNCYCCGVGVLNCLVRWCAPGSRMGEYGVWHTLHAPSIWRKEWMSKTEATSWWNLYATLWSQSLPWNESLECFH